MHHEAKMILSGMARDHRPPRTNSETTVSATITDSMMVMSE